MFDGNFRSRKEVNLSGRRKQATGTGSGSDNKQALLRKAEAQRQQRQEQLRQTQAARLLQRWTRGLLTRLHVLAEWLPHAHTSLVVTTHCVYYFRPLLALPKFSTSTSQLIARFAMHSLAASSLSASATPPTGNTANDHSSSWISRKRLVRVTLNELSPSREDTQLEPLVILLQYYWPLLSSLTPSHNGHFNHDHNDQLFLDLATCLARWIRVPNNGKAASPMRSSLVQSLCQWAILSSQQLQKPHAPALVASILLAGSKDLVSLLTGDLHTMWLLPLAQTLTIDGESNDSQLQPALYQATCKNMQNGNELRVLRNLLDLDDGSQFFHNSHQHPRPILQIINHVLRINSDLRLIASLVLRGDSFDIPSKAAHGATNAESTAVHVVDVADSDEEDYDMEAETKNDAAYSSAATKKTRTTSRLTRKDLLTVVKLNKIYQDSISQQKRDCLNQLKGTSFQQNPSADLILPLAKSLVQAPWLQWGLKMLDSSNIDATIFFESLALLMQYTTSLQPITKVGILSPLAFNKVFMFKLWTHINNEPTTKETQDLSLTIFCDLFAHYLVALSDVDFLQYHTNTDGDISQAVMATNVISTLRNRLYDLYWTRPVVVSEVTSQSTRGRLLLAATKVWNSLHERWNRLVRKHSFCEEEMWWFPPLSSREGDKAVVPTRQRQEDHINDDFMDIDQDDNLDEEEAVNRIPSPLEAETDALANAFHDPKMARILTCIPQALPFDQRVKLFTSLLKADKSKMNMGGGGEDMFVDGIVRERVRIHRARLYTDSMEKLNRLGPRLKHKVQVSFVNQHGAEEAGIDGGGVFKEFLDDLIKDGFASSQSDTDRRSHIGAPPLFSVTPQQTLAINFDYMDDPELLNHYEFLGRVLGKAVYESILVEPQFCLPFLNQLLGKINSTEDLKNYDEEYYNNLNKLKGLNDSEIEALGLNFEVTVGGHTSLGTPRTVELVPGGRYIAVKTKTHIFQYIHAVANQLLNVQGARQTKAFLRGFRDLIPASWVRLFSANELQNLISGDDSVRGIDVSSLKRATTYLGGYHESQPYIHDFWDIVENELTPEQQRKFLRFMTSCSRQPLLGFGSLDPSPAIQQIRLEEEPSKSSKLPSSQTCFNLLKLPNYKSKSLLRDKLLAAIESGAGFELT